MKAPVSISVVSSLFLAILAVSGTASGETNDLVRAQPTPSDPNLSSASSQILQLTQAGMDESVVTSFISNSGIFQLSADQIVYLNDLGVASRIIQAMLAHDREKLVAGNQSTNASNPSVALQLETAATSPVENPIQHNLAEVNVKTEAQSPGATVNALSPPKLDNLPKEQFMVIQRPPSAVPLKKKVFYPVRAPYPVELTAPIVFLDAPTF